MDGACAGAAGGGGSWWCLLVRGAPLASYGLVRPGLSLLQRLFAVFFVLPMCLSSVSLDSVCAKSSYLL